MTPAQFADEMMKIARQTGDTEMSHCDADDLLCKVLAELGYADGVKIFTEMDKWYA